MDQNTKIEVNAAHDPEIKGGSFSFSSEPITVGTGQVTLDEMPAYYYRGAKYYITVVDEQNNVEVSEWLMMHDSVNINLTNISTVNNLTQGYIGTFTGRLVRGHMQLLFQGNHNRHVIRYSRTPIKSDTVTPVTLASMLADGTYSQEGSGQAGPGSTPMLRLIDDADPGLGGNLNVNNHTIYGVNITLNPSGSVIVDGDILPNTNDTFNLGSATKNWSNIFVDNLKVGNLTVAYNSLSNRLSINDGVDTYLIPKNIHDLLDVTESAPSNNQALLWSTAGNAWSAANVSTLAISNVQVLGGNLIQSTSFNDTLTIEAGSGITITASNSLKKLTFSTVVVDTNTTYTATLTPNGSAVDFNLVGSDAVTDSIKFTPGTGIALSRSSPKELTISAVQVADLQSVASRGSTTTYPITIADGTAATSTTTGALKVTGGVGVGGSVYIGTDIRVTGNAYFTGNLTVNGTTTTVNSSTITVTDKNIELGTTLTPTDVTADGGGITLRGLSDKTITWTASNSAWNLSEHLNIPTGKQFYINNQSVLSSTTLGASVVNSSLTSVGTLTGLTSSGIVNVNNGTASTAINNGALVVSGGVGVGGALYVGGLLNIGGGVTVNGPIDLSSNIFTIGPVSEKLFSITGAIFSVTHDWSQYTIFYHTSPAGNFTPDFINVPLTNNRTISAILIIEQGTTPYVPTGVKINSVTQTLKWQTGTAPIGTTNGVDVITFSMFRVGAAWNVLGQLVSFG
jgi:hypothetical protein